MLISTAFAQDASPIGGESGLISILPLECCVIDRPTKQFLDKMGEPVILTMASSQSANVAHCPFCACNWLTKRLTKCPFTPVPCDMLHALSLLRLHRLLWRSGGRGTTSGVRQYHWPVLFPVPLQLLWRPGVCRKSCGGYPSRSC